MTPERDLWTAVIVLALEDARKDRKRKAEKYDCGVARTWFERGGQDFRDVCHMAGFDPEWVRDRALKIIAASTAVPVMKKPKQPIEWTPEQDMELMEMRRTMKVAEIAKATGRTYDSIRGRTKKIRAKMARCTRAA